jgi:hypothetical protein
LLRQIVIFDVELERACERDVENLKAFANGEDRQAARERVLGRLEFPGIARKIHTFVEHGWIRHGLTQKFRRDVGPAGHEQAVYFCERHFFSARVQDADVGVFGENGLKPFLVLCSQPCRDV